jgi:transposase
MGITSLNSVSKKTLAQLRGDSARERLLHRLHSVVLVLSGSSASQAGRTYGDSPRAVAYWVKRFKEAGLDGLGDEERSGRPPKLKPTQLKTLQILITRSQKEGKPMNAETMRTHVLKAYGVSLTHRQCWRILKRLRT